MKRGKPASSSNGDGDEDESYGSDPKTPKLLTESQWIWEGFVVLNGQRHYNEKGPQPVSLSDMFAYVSIEDISSADASWFLSVMRKMDKIFLEDTYAKLAKEREKKSRSNRKARGTR